MFSKCENIVKEKMNYFQNPNLVLMLQEIVQTVWCEKLNFLGFSLNSFRQTLPSFLSVIIVNLIRPIAVYGCETWALKESITQKLSVFERKILRKIFGPTKEANGIWRIKTNKDLDELIKHRNTINYVKVQR